MELTPLVYKQWLQRQALTVTKRDRKHGGSYRVKDAMDAIHIATHRSDGIDPYDGQPMNASLLVAKNPTLSTLRRGSTAGISKTLPHCETRPRSFDLSLRDASRQTANAKGEMSTDEYLEHCQAVVRFRGTGGSNTAANVL